MVDVAILQSGQSRIFLQADGISPKAAYEYFGHMQLEDPQEPQGESTPTYLPSSRQRNKWEIVDQIVSTPELGSMSFTQRMDRYLSDAWWEIKERGCFINIQAVNSQCTDPSNFHDWQSKILYQFARLTSFSHNTLNVLEGGENAVVNVTGELEFRRMIPIRRIKFSERAASVVVAEVLDGLYHDTAQCGDCGPASDGCQKAYFLTLANAGSPGLSSQIAYTLDGADTFAQLDIPTLGGLSGTRLAVVGQYLVVISEATGSHHYSLLSDVDDGETAWVEVDSGYVSTKGPRAIHSKSAAETFIAAAGGYIYRMDDPTAAVEVVTDGSLTSQNFNDIHGYGSVIVAVGNNNAIAASENAGDSFTLVTGPTAGVALNTVWCMNERTWFVGTADGRLYYTLNSGTTWTQINFGSGVTSILDVKFADDVIGYMAVQVGGAARVYRTTDSGHSWQYKEPAIDKLPSSERINFVAPCGHNRVAAGGRKTAGGDGLLCVAE